MIHTHLRKRLPLSAAMLLLASGLALADGSSGGVRALGQAGAVVARADDPAATALNPAGLAALDGLQVVLGAVSLSGETELEGIGGLGRFTSDHDEVLPAVAVSWKPEGPARLAFGLSVDSPLSSSLRWSDPSFPVPGNARRFDVELLDVRPAVAWRVSDRLSLGLAAHWVSGELRDDNRVLLAVTRNPGTTFVFAERSALADDVSGYGAELGLLYRQDGWGWGLDLRSEIEVDGRSVNTVVPEQPPEELVQTVLDLLDPLRAEPSRLSFTLPAELRAGLWVGVSEDVTLELDAVFADWSGTGNQLVRPRPRCDECADLEALALDDTLSLRLGAEWSASDRWRLRAGLGHEPGPLAEAALQPVLPAGDAWVASLGATRQFTKASVDVAYSLRRHDSVGDAATETLESTAHAVGLSLRWNGK